MRKIYFLYALLVMCTMLGFLPLKAEVVTPYKENFDDLTLDPPEDFRPPKWGRIVEGMPKRFGGFDYVEYAGKAAGGAADNGAYLEAGSQEYFSYDSYENIPVNDLLITPALTGEVKFYLKRTSEYTDPDLKVYKCTPRADGAGYEQGELLEDYTAKLTTTWQQFTLNVESDTYLGFRLEYAALDELEAASANVVGLNSMRFATVTLTSATDVQAGEDNKFRIAFTFTLKNNGDNDLTPGTDGYSVSLVNQTAGNRVEKTLALESALAAGATSGELTIEADVDAGDTPGEMTFALRENISGQTSTAETVDVLPYKPQLLLIQPGQTDEIEKPVDFGMVTKMSQLRLAVANKGGAPLRVTGIQLPEGYTADVKTPFEVAAQTDSTITLTFTAGAAKGEQSGKIVFTADGIAEKAYDLTAIVPADGIWLENFEIGQPANMIFEKNWSIADSPAGLGTTGNTAWAENVSTSEMTKIISPLLTVEEGETLTFYAARQGYSTKLNIYYSADRTNWQLAQTINEFTADLDPDATTSYNAFAFTRFTVSGIPAGNRYIAFESGNVRLDDIYGFRLAKVAHDWYITASTLPAKATVNNAYTASLTATNMNSLPEAADTYTATLYLNGTAAATAETAEWAAGESKTFNFAYTPHEAGEYTAYIELATEGYSVKSAETTVTIAKEQAVNEVVVGNANGTNNGVFNPTWKYSGSETVYNKSRLGLEDNAKIVSLAFMGTASADVDFDFNIKVWLENTDDVEASITAPRNTDDMTLVYDGSVRIKKSDAEGYVPVIDLVLDEAFVYDGSNLRVATHLEIPDFTSNVNFAVENGVPEGFISYEDDYVANRTDWGWSGSLPVIRLATEKEVLTASGTVTDKDGASVADATVTLTAGEVIYQGTTDAEGQYHIEVFQPDKDYTMTVAKESYPTATTTVSFAEGNVVKNIVLGGEPTTGLDEVADGTRVFSHEGRIQIVSPVAGEATVYSLTGVLVEHRPINAGSNELTLPAGSYVVKLNNKAYKVINK